MDVDRDRLARERAELVPGPRLPLVAAPTIENVHSSSGVCGVGPAERTGKSSVRYWPGGTRLDRRRRRAGAAEAAGDEAHDRRSPFIVNRSAHQTNAPFGRTCARGRRARAGERLRHVIVGAQFQSHDPVRVLPASRRQDHRQIERALKILVETGTSAWARAVTAGHGRHAAKCRFHRRNVTANARTCTLLPRQNLHGKEGGRTRPACQPPEVLATPPRICRVPASCNAPLRTSCDAD